MHEYEQGALFGYVGEAEVLVAKPVPLPLCPLKIPHYNRIGTSAVRSRLYKQVLWYHHICDSLS